SSRRRVQGAGLGLAIVRKLIDTMSGTVQIEGKEGEGTTVVFTVPAPVSSVRPSGIVRAVAEAPLRTLEIVVADDNPVNRRVTQRMLERLEQRATIFSNGKEVVSHLVNEHADVLLLDLQMPELDGYEVARTVRERWPEREITIIALSADGASEARERALSAGMNAFLSKPITLTEMRRVLLESTGVTVPEASSGSFEL
ncbi:MAG: response regulator, partial [Myxococcales bacterium]|nr:response regulator [Myxococcales bacterium]